MSENHRSHNLGVVNTQRGSVLVEFSLIAVSISLLIALVVDVARMVFITQVLQETARVAARELSLLPLSPTMTFEEALEEPQVKSQIFDPSALVIEVERFGNSRELEEFVDGLPIVNRMLRPLMTFEKIAVDGRSRDVLRFPGTLLNTGQPKSDFGSSVIPYIDMSGKANGHEIWWKSIVEEIREDPGDPQSGAFSLLTSHSNQPSGLVALRVNYPFHPMFMSWLPKTGMTNSGVELKTDKSALPSQRLVAQGQPISEELNSEFQSSDRPSLSADSFKKYPRILFGQSVHRREVFK